MMSMRMFQSTPPRGGEPGPPGHRCKGSCFNPRPRAGANARKYLVWELYTCFNPRPRAGANEAKVIYVGDTRVSIHAPARGRTLHALPPPPSLLFQSTPPRGGEPSTAGLRLPARFNPRPRAGANGSEGGYGTPQKVSIHAPARGRTGVRQIPNPAELVSIHAPARGRTYQRQETNDD